MLIALLTLVGAPLLGTLILTFLGKSTFKARSHWVAIGCMVVSFLASIRIFLFALQGGTFLFEPFTWIQTQAFEIPFGLYIDSLSALFCFFVTLVGTLIHIYSAGYMHGDKGYPRFFTYLNLFVFFMLMLVLANNFLFLFLFWEGVGLCSYLLIGFWFTRGSACKASQKAFLVNRIGDVCFLAAIFFILAHFGTLNFDEVFLAAPLVSSGVVTLITLLLFAGATGKSAQIPLFTWLPDAMEGPSPVSALIHAATMVTAGVYLIVRAFPLFVMSPVTLTVVAWVGALTALFAATIALRQHDIKRILAYSTISQLGYMFLALGLALPAAAIFHLVTHAFFKALLFLGAGSLMHALGDETDIRKMGNLRPYLKWTWATFLVGALALAGVPPLSGFFSKEEILKGAFAGGHTLLGWVALVASFLTAFYIFRAYFLVFHTNDRSEKGASAAHESGPSMVWPLAILSVLSILAGGWAHYAGDFSLSHLFEGSRVTDAALHGHAGWVVAASITVAFLGILLAWLLSARSMWDLSKVPVLAWIGRVWEQKYWIDELYATLITTPLTRFSRFARNRLDEAGVDGCVRLIVQSLALGSGGLRRMHAGNVQVYLFVMWAAIALGLGLLWMST